jgi:AraC-like DNA-binding protein
MEPEISPEQFIAEHTFLYVSKGAANIFDGNKHHRFSSGEYGLGRRNHLARYSWEKAGGELKKVFVFFDEAFLRRFQERHAPVVGKFVSPGAVVRLEENELIHIFMASLLPYYSRGKIDASFADVKREELLLILLRRQPALAGVFFDYGIPQKIDIEEFMNRNYKFNIPVERLAFLTGRSLSAFKRDFNAVFNDTPNHWLVQRRLKEAYFLLEKKKKKPAEIYLDLGFENLSHFSYAFKKRFGVPPKEMIKK